MTTRNSDGDAPLFPALMLVLMLAIRGDQEQKQEEDRRRTESILDGGESAAAIIAALLAAGWRETAGPIRGGATRRFEFEAANQVCDVGPIRTRFAVRPTERFGWPSPVVEARTVRDCDSIIEEVRRRAANAPAVSE